MKDNKWLQLHVTGRTPDTTERTSGYRSGQRNRVTYDSAQAPISHTNLPFADSEADGNNGSSAAKHFLRMAFGTIF